MLGLRKYTSSPSSRRKSSFWFAEICYSAMEDELTCPVCLELFADPLMLPCSHSVCKQCLQDIFKSKKGKAEADQKIECPSCRKSLDFSQDSLATLPRNLALENIVIRYQEEYSKRLTKRSSLDKTEPEDAASEPHFETAKTTQSDFPVEHRQRCELCEGSTPSKAAWFCVQCEVAYCHPCLDKYHPKRGSLIRHRIRQPSDVEEMDKIIFCDDHETEAASIFCDDCKALVCHLCVCDGVGKHAGHKILDSVTACGKIKNIVEENKNTLETLLNNHIEQQCKVEEVSNEVKNIHKETLERIEHQYNRIIEDLTSALEQQKEATIQNMAALHSQCSQKLHKYLEENRRHAKHLQVLSESCQNILEEKSIQSILLQATDVAPIAKEVEECAEKTKELDIAFQDTQKEKSAHVMELYSGTRKFRRRAAKAVQGFLENDEERCRTIIPHIQSPTSPKSPTGGKSEAPRVQNKYLITWGFTSTSFTAEELTQDSNWTITIEKNTGHWGNLTTGYLFGVGISSAPLNFKDLVGMNDRSLGIVCNNGTICFANDNKLEKLMELGNLPISISLFVTTTKSDCIVFAYKISCTHWGDILTGKRVITDTSLKKNVCPVFTVSQRVKLLFPTFV